LPFLSYPRVSPVLFFFYLRQLPSCSPVFPYTTLFRSRRPSGYRPSWCSSDSQSAWLVRRIGLWASLVSLISTTPAASLTSTQAPDRKSTRLNSSHVKISYTVFCL